MIESPVIYVIIVGILGGGLWWVETRSLLKFFNWLPGIVLVYLVAIALSNSGLFAQNASQHQIYAYAKGWLLPSMLFLMMLQLDLRTFRLLGRELILAYIGAVVSLTTAFFIVFIAFGFGPDAAAVFGALSGSWTGGTANMLAVADALNLSELQLGPALVTDALLYSVWVSTLLLLVPFAHAFNRWSRAANTVERFEYHPEKRVSSGSVAVLLLLAMLSAAVVRFLAPLLPFLPSSTWIVLLATLFGSLGSFSRLKSVGGNDRIASLMLYVLIALVGSQASLSSMGAVPLYLAAAGCILALHAVMMIVLARLFSLSLFSIGIASLSNIGGVASAPLLAAAYDRRLIGAAVVMAVTGYLVGTIVGLLVASGLARVAS